MNIETPSDDDLIDMRLRFFEDEWNEGEFAEWFATYGLYLIEAEMRRRGVPVEPPPEEEEE